MHCNNWPHEIFCDLLVVTTVDLFQKVILTQSHIYIQIYDVNPTGEQK